MVAMDGAHQPHGGADRVGSVGIGDVQSNDRNRLAARLFAGSDGCSGRLEANPANAHGIHLARDCRSVGQPLRAHLLQWSVGTAPLAEIRRLEENRTGVKQRGLLVANVRRRIVPGRPVSWYHIERR